MNNSDTELIGGELQDIALQNKSVADAIDGIDYAGDAIDLSQYGYIDGFGNSAYADYYLYGDSPYYYEQGYDQDGNAIKDESDLLEYLKKRTEDKKYASPLLVLALMLLFFPAGLITMLFFTKWGAFPKIMITLFVIAAAIAIYEVIVYKQIFELTSLIDTVKYVIEQYL